LKSLYYDARSEKHQILLYTSITRIHRVVYDRLLIPWIMQSWHYMHIVLQSWLGPWDIKPVRRPRVYAQI